MTGKTANDRYWAAARIAHRMAVEAQVAAPSYAEGLTAYDRAFRTYMAEYEKNEEERNGRLFGRPGPLSPRSFINCPECGTPISHGDRCAHCQGV